MHAGRKETGACAAEESRLEDYLEGRLDTRAEAEVRSHLASCPRCSLALEKAKAGAGLLVALQGRPAPRASAYFVARVMNALRQERRYQDSWRPVERFAWRFCWLASAVALVLAFFMLRMQPSMPAVSAAQQNQVQVLVSVPQSQPVIQDDSLLLVASDDNGR